MLTKTKIPVPNYRIVSLIVNCNGFKINQKCYLLSEDPSCIFGEMRLFDLNPIGTSEVITISSKNFE